MHWGLKGSGVSNLEESAAGNKLHRRKSRDEAKQEGRRSAGLAAAEVRLIGPGCSWGVIDFFFFLTTGGYRLCVANVH